MRRFFQSAGGAFLSALLAVAATSRAAAAQTGATTEGALELILPIGARSTGMGQAMAAAGTGAEAIWGNPALVGRASREGVLTVRNKTSPADGETDAGTAFVFPIRQVGVVAVSLRYINFGTLDAVNRNAEQTGTFVTTSKILGATFATTFGNRLAVGITAKQLIRGIDCTGDCNPDQTNAPSPSQPSVNAVDVGAQYFVTHDSVISLGFGVHNLGPRFQIIDSPQADPLPTRVDLGVLYSPHVTQMPGVTVRVAADVVARVWDATGLGFRLGAEASYLERYHFRAGYVMKGPGEVSGPTFGFGLASGKLRVDLTQMVTDVATEGARPTFLSLRYLF